MKQLLIAVLLWGTLFSCSKSEPCLSERGVSMQTFAYQDQLLHQKKFGLKIKHPGTRLEAVSTRLWFAGKLYFAKDFTWRYAMGETEGILHNGVNSSDMTYFRVEELKICISNRWYSLR
jgi:lipoprotein